MVAYAKRHCVELDGLLFYKVDRAARNLFDYVELERLESEDTSLHVLMTAEAHRRCWNVMAGAADIRRAGRDRDSLRLIRVPLIRGE